MTKTEEQKPINSNRIIWLVLALVTLAIYFFALGSLPLLGPDEPRYAQVAREMYERGDWVTPTLGGFNWFEKPVLLYWLQIVSYKLFGVSEFAARFGSAIFGLLTIASLYILGKFSNAETQRCREDEPAKHKEQRTKDNLANWLFVISASSIGLLAFSRGASFDIILTFPITASLVSFFIFDQSGGKTAFTRRFSLIGFYFFIGVALLAKGLIGIVFPIAIVFFYYVLIRKLPGKTFIFSLVWGTILSLLVASVWYVPMYLQNGWTFVDEFFIQHHFARYTSNKYQHPQPFYFFLWVLPLMTLPWLPLFLASIWDFIKRLFARRDTEKPSETDKLSIQHSALNTFAVAWLLVPLVFFSFSGSKLPGYILPALPAALILTAEYVSRFVRNNRTREIALQVAALAMFAVIAIALQFFFAGFARRETVKDLIVTANAQGFADAKILNLSTTEHNAEFYAPGRLIRNSEGKLRHFWNVAEIADFIRLNGNQPVLVLVPFEYVYQLSEGDSVNAVKLTDNGELGIYAVSLKAGEMTATDE